MGSYWAFWKRGWWAWLLLLCSNIAIGIFIAPLAFAFHDDKRIYLLSAVGVWFLVGAPIWGWLFEYFAASSSRLITQQVAEDISA